jgi:hypothetical protein
MSSPLSNEIKVIRCPERARRIEQFHPVYFAKLMDISGMIRHLMKSADYQKAELSFHQDSKG